MPTSKNKPKAVTFVLSDEEHRRLKAIAVLNKCSMAQYLRALIKAHYMTRQKDKVSS